MRREGSPVGETGGSTMDPVRTMHKTKIFTNAVGILITCPLYQLDIQDIIVAKPEEIHQLQNLMFRSWIDSVMTLQEQSLFLDHHEHVCLIVWFMTPFVKKKPLH